MALYRNTLRQPINLTHLYQEDTAQFSVNRQTFTHQRLLITLVARFRPL